MKKNKKIISFFMTILMVLSLFLYPINLFFSLFIKKGKTTNNEFSSFGNVKKIYSKNKKIKKILKLFNEFGKNNKDCENYDFDNETMFLGKWSTTTDSYIENLIILPYTTVSRKNYISYFRKLREITRGIDDVKIVFDNILTKYPWFLFFYKYFLRIKPIDFKSYTSLISINSYNDSCFDKKNIPNLALCSKKFYACYNKYISDYFPMINQYNDVDDLKKKLEFSDNINNYGYDEFLNCKTIFMSLNLDDNVINNEIRTLFNQSYKILKNNTTDFRSKVAVIFPVYNNSFFLKNRSFKSCLFNHEFKNTIFIFVDDGSNVLCKNAILDLQENFNNVKCFFYSDGGSGSPSRARNKGLEIAIKEKIEYIMYLDPDNSFTTKAIDIALNEINDIIDIVVYNMWTSGKAAPHSKEECLIKYNQIKDDKYLNNGFDSFYEFRFRSFNMQQTIIKTKILQENKIHNFEDSIGEDEIFWYQILMSNPKMLYKKHTIANYYNYNSMSLTNNINDSFFIKALNGENNMYHLLISSNLISDYLKNVYYCKFYNAILTYYNNNISKNIIFLLWNTFLKYDKELIEISDDQKTHRSKCLEFFILHNKNYTIK